MQSLRIFSLIIILSSFLSGSVMGVWPFKKKATPTNPAPVAKPAAVEKKSANPNPALEQKSPGCTERVLGMCKKKQVEEPKKSRWQRFTAGLPNPLERAKSVAKGIAKTRMARHLEKKYNVVFDGFGEAFNKKDPRKRMHARLLFASKAVIGIVAGHKILSLLPDYVTWIVGGLAGLYIAGNWAVNNNIKEKIIDFYESTNG